MSLRSRRSGQGLCVANPVLSNRGASYYTPTTFGWFDGATTLLKSTALTGASATTNNTLVTCWFSPEDVDSILGLFTLFNSGEGGYSMYANRVGTAIPERNGMKVTQGADNNYTANYTYKNVTPVNANLYFMVAYCDYVAGETSFAIWNGSSWYDVVAPTGGGFSGALDFTLTDEIGIGRHFGVAGTHWRGRIADFWLKSNVTAPDLTSATVRNAFLVDPENDGTGYGRGDPDIFFRGGADAMNGLANAGAGGPFSTLLGAVADYPYTQRRAVLNGTSTAYSNAAVTGLDNPLTAFTFSCWARFNATTGRSFITLYGGTGVFTVARVVTTGALRLSCTDSGGVNTLGTSATSASGMSLGTTDAAKHHIMVAGSIASDVIKGYLDGVEVFSVAPSAASLADFSAHGGIRVATNAGGTLFLDGSIGDVWFADSYLDPATHAATFYNGGTPPLLTGFQGAVGGVTPLILMGQGMSAAHWNAGKNLGTGGTMTAAGTVTLGA